MSQFKNKYRVESTRLNAWDYSATGYYFVTICAKDRKSVFGEVVNGEMVLSPSGEIVAEEWQKTPQIRLNVTMDEWVIMPNHLHGIIVIHDSTDIVETPRRGVSTGGRNWKPNSLGSIVNQIKSISTKRIRKAGFVDFGWQTRFYDRILRDENSLQKARQYILDNPSKWELDKDNPVNLFM